MPEDRDEIELMDYLLDIKNFPEIKAENPPDTNLVQISIRIHDAGQAKSILGSLFIHLKAQLNVKADIETKQIES